MVPPHPSSAVPHSCAAGHAVAGVQQCLFFAPGCIAQTSEQHWAFFLHLDSRPVPLGRQLPAAVTARSVLLWPVP